MSKVFYILIVILIMLSLALYWSSTPAPAVSSPSPVCRYTEESVLRRINSVRSTPLVMDKTLDEFAESRLSEVRAKFDHSGFLARYNSIYGGDYATGEILGSGYCGKPLITAWLNSPAHRDAMLRSRYDSVGIAGDGTYTVVIFGDLR